MIKKPTVFLLAIDLSQNLLQQLPLARMHINTLFNDFPSSKNSLWITPCLIFNLQKHNFLGHSIAFVLHSTH